MIIDWVVVATIAAPIITLFIGVWVNRHFENRPILLSYFSHISAFQFTPPGGQPVQVNTHSVVLKNTGRRSATNVRLSHNVLPDFSIWPALGYRVEDLPGGSREIVIPTLVPREEVTVSYLYFPPLTADQINAGIKSEQGFARTIPVLLQRQYPQWFNLTAAGFILVGIVALLYVAYHLAVML